MHDDIRLVYANVLPIHELVDSNTVRVTSMAMIRSGNLRTNPNSVDSYIVCTKLHIIVQEVVGFGNEFNF